MANQINVTPGSGAQQIIVESGTGNVTVNISRAVIGTVANVASANYANYANIANTANLAIALNANINNVSISGGTNGYFLQTDGAGNLTWAVGGGGGGNVGGSNTQIQYNDGGNFNGSSSLTFNNTTNLTTISNANIGLVHSNIIPNANITYDIGNNTNRFKDLYLANSTIYLGSQTINANATNTSISGIITGNGAGLFSIQSANIIGPVANADYANFSGNAYSVDGANVSGSVANATYANTAGSANSVAGANVSGTVANANFAAYANVANSANSVAVANVSGIGNIATVNLDGNASNVLRGDGSFAPEASNLNANYANFAGDVVNANQPNITSIGNLSSLIVNGNANIEILNANTQVNTSKVVAISDLTLATDNDNDALATIFANAGAIQLGGGSNSVAADPGLYAVNGANTLTLGTPNNVYAVLDDINSNIGFSVDTGTSNVVIIDANGITSNANITSNNYFLGNKLLSNGDIRLETVNGNGTGAVYANADALYLGGGNSNTAVGAEIKVGNGRGSLEIGSWNKSWLIFDEPNNNGTLRYTATGGASNIFNADANGFYIGNSNINLYGNGNLTATSFAGDGGNLSNIQAGNISGTIANANYATYAGNVVGANQSNITSVGNLLSLTINSGVANTGTSEFDGNGIAIANINFASNINVISKTTYAPSVSTDLSDAIILKNFDANLRYRSNFYYESNGNHILGMSTQILCPVGNASANTSNAYIPTNIIYSIPHYGSDLNTTNTNTGFGTITIAGSGISVAPATPASGPVLTNFTWGDLANNAQQVLLRNTRRRGNADVRANVAANDYLGNIEWIPAGKNSAGTGVTSSRGLMISPKVDSAYTGANGETVPSGLELSVVNSSNAHVTHNFYANGVTTFAGNINATNANLGNLATANFVTGTLTTNAQPNITSVGNLVSLTIDNGVANTGISQFNGNGLTIANINFASNINVISKTTYAPVTSSDVSEGIIIKNFDATNTRFRTNLYWEANGNHALGMAMQIACPVGNASANTSNAFIPTQILYNLPHYGSDLNNPNTNTGTGTITIAGSGISIAPATPASGPVFTNFTWGDLANNAQQVLLRNTRRRGNADVRANVAANDYLGNIEWIPAGKSAGGAIVSSRGLMISPKVDSAYTGANGETVPSGLEVSVVNSSNAHVTHNFYANGVVAFAANISATNANLGNLVSANFVSGTLTTAAQPNITSVGTLSSATVTGNVVAGNVYANSGTIGATTGTFNGNVTAGNFVGTFANANSKAYFTGANGQFIVQVDGNNSATFGSRSLTIEGTGPNASGSNAGRLDIQNASLNITEEDLGGGANPINVDNYYNTGFTPPWNFKRYRGTKNSPSYIQAGDQIGGFRFQAYAGANYTNQDVFNWSITASSNDGNGNIVTSSYMSTANNTNTSSMNFDSDIINLTVNSELNVSNTIDISSGNTYLYGNGDINAVGRLSYLRTFGDFYSNATQTSAGANTVNYMTLNNTGTANGVSIANSDEITIARTGNYNIQFSAQLGHDTNATANVEIWLVKNGNNVANTNSLITLQKDDRYVVSWNWLVNANTANDYYQIAWASPDTNVELIAVDAANTIANVAIPSVIVTVTPVGA